MASIDRQIKSNVYPKALVDYIPVVLNEAFKAVKVKRPDNWFYCDLYETPSGARQYYRVSFYVGVPPNADMKLRGEAVAAELTKTTGRKWTAYYCKARTRKSNSIKVYTEYDIGIS